MPSTDHHTTIHHPPAPFLEDREQRRHAARWMNRQLCLGAGNAVDGDDGDDGDDDDDDGDDDDGDA